MAMVNAPHHASTAPVFLAPVLDPKPWGGRRLESCGIALEDTRAMGEALLTAPEATVVSGPLAGASLAALARRAPHRWIGELGLRATGGRAIFPLLVKLIDANADLSIQVHPDDIAAATANLGTGKTEAWHILDAAPGSVLYLGLRDAADAAEFMAACRQCDGSAAAYLRQLPATPGMTVIVPAGTPHAIGSGCLIYEIQQPSNVTFRLDDWGRVDAAGQHRPLHHEAGFAALDPDSRPAAISPIRLGDAPRRELLAATRFFALERITFEPGERATLATVSSPLVLLVRSGAVSLTAADWSGRQAPGETLVIPAGAEVTVMASEPAVLLRGWVPDLEREVIAPARLAGASPDAIAALGIHLGT